MTQGKKYVRFHIEFREEGEETKVFEGDADQFFATFPFPEEGTKRPEHALLVTFLGTAAFKWEMVLGQFDMIMDSEEREDFIAYSLLRTMQGSTEKMPL